MPTGRKGILVVVAIVILGLVAAMFFPVLYDASQEPETETTAQTQGERITLKAPLESELDSVNETSGNVTVSLYNTDTGAVVTATNISEDSNETVVLGGDTITIRNNGVTSTDTASITYEFPVDIGWPDTAKSLLDNILLFLLFVLLAGVLLVIMVIYND